MPDAGSGPDARTESYDHVVVGAGLRGLLAALRVLRAEQRGSLLVVDAAAAPGGSVRTVRTNGFLCELGPFAFASGEVQPLLDRLSEPPPTIDLEPVARTGSLWSPAGLEPIALDPVPVGFRSGSEAIVQACRRQLGPCLRLGRAVTALAFGEAGFRLELGGEVATRLTTRRLTLGLPTAVAARLLGSFEPALGDAAQRVGQEPRAFVWFGGLAAEAPELRGFGIAPASGVQSPLAELLFASEHFPGRARPGHFLLRAELVSPPGAEDAALMATAEAEVRRWTGTRATFAFRKLHHFAVERPDGALVECRTRLRTLPHRLPGLALAAALAGG